MSAVYFAVVLGLGLMSGPKAQAGERTGPLDSGQSCEPSKRLSLASAQAACSAIRLHSPVRSDRSEKPTVPSELSPDDVRRYRLVFELQRSGDLAAADREIARLGDTRLLGHVLHDRYIRVKDYRASYPELQAWLAAYPDHPGAQEVYGLALKRKSKKDSPPRRPVVQPAFGSWEGRVGRNVDIAAVTPRTADPKTAALFPAVTEALKADAPDKALALLQSSNLAEKIDPADYDRLRTSIAAYLFYAGDDRRALDYAAASSARSGGELPRADWIAGMAAWRLGLLDRAARHFETLAVSPRSSSWTASAAAYWAARVHLRNRSPQQVTAWLEQASRFPYTFYGMLARRTLGLDLDFQWDLPKLSGEHLKAIGRYPAGLRGSALIAVGEKERAEQELARINPKGDAVLTQALLALAEHGGMPAFAIKVAHLFRDQDGSAFDAGLYPIPPWTPKGGFAVDRALVYAVMRQESRFNPRARSTAGAAGLMQLMPDTAAQMSGARRLTSDGRKGLFDPSVNVDLGQRYLSTLLDDPELGSNLFLLITAYNGGPANVARWRKSINDGGDPLLFIESIPFGETRGFIERVMANYWMYRTRLGLPTRSLTAIASGEWPIYDRLEDPLFQIAQHESN